MGYLEQDSGRKKSILKSGVRLAGCVVATAGIGLGGNATAGSLVTDPDFVDNIFEAYYLRPCLDGPGALLAQGWTNQEIIDYNNAICAEVFNAGTFNSTDTYASTSNIGSAGAQSKTSDTVAARQVESVQDRLDEIKVEDDRDGAWGMMLSAQTGETERFSTNREVGYDSDLDGVLGGPDYRFNDGLVVGLALGVTTDDASYENNAGKLETESRSLMVYSTYLLGDNAYIDGYIGFASLDFSSERDVSVDGEAADNFGFSGQIDSDFDGDQTLLGVSIGYDWFRQNYSYGVNAALDYSKTEIDAFDEEGSTGLELEYPDQDSKSLTLTLGGNVARDLDMGWGTLTLNAGLAAVYQGENDSRSFDARLIVSPDVDTTTLTLETDSPDREYLLASLGLVAATSAGTQYFLNYERLESHDFLETWVVSLGFLAEF